MPDVGFEEWLDTAVPDDLRDDIRRALAIMPPYKIAYREGIDDDYR